MTSIYLWMNSILYAVLALLCLVRLEGTSRALGYLTLNGSGRSEYLTVYGGLQLGLALYFAWTALRPERHAAGLLLALVMYACIVIVRWRSVVIQGPVERMTLAVGGLETALLVIALLLWWTRTS